MRWLRCFLAIPLTASIAAATAFTFSTGSPDARLGAASRPNGIEIETADDFILTSTTSIMGATFTGLMPTGASLSTITQVVVEIYRVFPLDSTNPPSGNVPTRVNSPSDTAFDSRDVTSAFSAQLINSSFTAINSVLNGINKAPNQTTGGEGPISGEEVQFSITFGTPFNLPAGHYFFVPQVALSSGNFYWLSTPSAQFTGDLQAWIRNANLSPDWLRIGTDVIGSGTFNMSFSLSGSTVDVPEPATIGWACAALCILGLLRARLLSSK